MRPFWATKDTYEREDDESERLVRPSPKVKPPRRDLRRDTIDPEEDSDDEETKEDDDRSLNYKTIGGSLSGRVVSRFVQGKGKKHPEWVKVRNEDDVVTRVAPDTLKEEPGKYEKVPKNEPVERGGIRPPRKPQKPQKPHYHKEHLPHPQWPDPRPLPKKPPQPPKLVKPVKKVPVPVPPEPETQPKPKPPGWVWEKRKLASDVVARFLDAKKKHKQKVEQRKKRDQRKPKPQKKPPKMVTVRRKDDEKVVQVSEETLKEKGGEYEKLDKKDQPVPEPEAKKPPPEEKPEAKKPTEDTSKDDAFYSDAGGKLREQAKSNPSLAAKLKVFSDPTSQFSGIAKENPGFQLAPFFKGVDLPSGIETFGDIFKALQKSVPQKGKKKPPTPAPEKSKAGEPKAPEPAVEAPKAEEPKAPAPAVEAPKAEEPKAPEPSAETPKTEEPKAPEEPSTEEKPKKEKGKKDKGEKKEKPKKDKKDKSKKDKFAPFDDPVQSTSRVFNETEEGREVFSEMKSTFGKELAAKFVQSGFLLNDAKNVLVTHSTAKVPLSIGKLDSFVNGASKYYAEPGAKVPPPKTAKDMFGVERPWDELSPQEQRATGHAGKVVGMSMAARERVSGALKSSGLPDNFAKSMSSFMLGGRKGTSGAAWVSYNDALSDSSPPISPEKATKLFGKMRNPKDQEVLAGYYQGKTFQEANKKFFGGDTILNERLSDDDFINQLEMGTAFVRERDKAIPLGVPKKNLARRFRMRAVEKLKTLHPERAAKIQARVDKIEAREYDLDHSEWKKNHSAWETETRQRNTRRNRLLKKLLKEHKDTTSEDWENSIEFKREGLLKRDDPPEPVEPTKPVRYGLSGDKKDLAEQMHESLASQPEIPTEEPTPESTPRVKEARVVGRWLAYSTCWNGKAMGTTASDRVSVYWGVDPYPKGHEGFAPYAPWSQAHARDLGEADFGKLLASAREWLKKSPVLSAEGMNPDAQFRAALDLAIHSTENGRYSVGLHPELYNTLLAKLAGAPDPAKETLTTIQSGRTAGCVYEPTGERPMKASSVIRQHALKLAGTNPAVSYELLELADKVAQEEQGEGDQGQGQEQGQQKQGGQIPEAFKENIEKMKEKAKDKDDDKDEGKKEAYLKLRSACIRTASENPHLRPAMLPVLQLIKQIG
jgi:hypothetical protein